MTIPYINSKSFRNNLLRVSTVGTFVSKYTENWLTLLLKAKGYLLSLAADIVFLFKVRGLASIQEVLPRIMPSLLESYCKSPETTLWLFHTVQNSHKRCLQVPSVISYHATNLASVSVAKGQMDVPCVSVYGNCVVMCHLLRSSDACLPHN